MMPAVIPTPRRAVALAAIVACVLISTSAATAQDAPPGTSDFTLGIGYAHISVGDDDSPLDSEDAIKFDPSLTFALIPGLPQLRLGPAVGVTIVTDNSKRVIIANDGRLIVAGSSEIPLWFVQPELRLSWRQYLDPDHTIFVEPGVAAGWTYGQIELDDDEETAADESFRQSDWTTSARVFLRAGARVAGGYAGVEASWMRGNDLDLAANARGNVEEFYIGVYGALAF
jgi:hypothetical protein